MTVDSSESLAKLILFLCLLINHTPLYYTESELGVIKGQKIDSKFKSSAKLENDLRLPHKVTKVVLK